MIKNESGATSPTKKNPRKTRYRQRNPNKWFRKQQIKLRNSGKEYKTKNKKGEWVTVPAKKVGPPCTCKDKCFEKFTPEEIDAVFKSFWKLGNYNLQNMYLCNVIERKKTKREEKLGPENKSRVKGINKYCVLYKGKKTIVCKIAFENIHAITRDRIQEHNRKRTDTGGVEDDQRGKNTFNNRVSEEQIKLVHEHIIQIPSRRSHYTIYMNPNKRYVDTPDQMSQMALYRLYVAWLNEFHQGQVPVKATYYLHIFNDCYNLEIVSPKQDVCDTCIILKTRYRDATLQVVFLQPMLKN